MTRTAYLQKVQRDFDEGRISVEAYDCAIANAQNFTDDEEPTGGCGYYIGKPYPWDDLYNGIQDEPF